MLGLGGGGERALGDGGVMLFGGKKGRGGWRDIEKQLWGCLR